jgi:hypothetical protein
MSQDTRICDSRSLSSRFDSIYLCQTAKAYCVFVSEPSMVFFGIEALKVHASNYEYKHIRGLAFYVVCLNCLLSAVVNSLYHEAFYGPGY